MAKRKQKAALKKEPSTATLADTLNEELLMKLKQTKNELTKIEEKKEKERQEQIRRERKEREKNKSFEELLNEYGDIGSKYSSK